MLEFYCHINTFEILSKFLSKSLYIIRQFSSQSVTEYSVAKSFHSQQGGFSGGTETGLRRPVKIKNKYWAHRKGLADI